MDERQVSRQGEQSQGPGEPCPQTQKQTERERDRQGSTRKIGKGETQGNTWVSSGTVAVFPTPLNRCLQATQQACQSAHSESHTRDEFRLSQHCSSGPHPSQMTHCHNSTEISATLWEPWWIYKRCLLTSLPLTGWSKSYHKKRKWKVSYPKLLRPKLDPLCK